MAEDREPGAPSLEPPSLFARKRRKNKGPATPPPAAEVPVGAAADGPVDPPAETAPVEAAPVETAPVETAPVETAPASTAPVETRVAPPDEEAPAPGALPVTEPERRPLPGDSPTTILDEPSRPVAAPPVTEPAAPAAPRDPWLRGRPAAALTGLLVGVLIVAATAGSLRLCTLVKGTSSCGGPGLLLLLAILVVAVLVGGALLRAAAVPQAASTSFLAVGLLSVVTLLFLVGSIFQWWMIIAIPVVSVATFLLSHWVTTAYIEPENEASERQRQAELHDIR